MEKIREKISVRRLVEFLCRSGDLKKKSGRKADLEAMQKGGRLHRKIQKSMGGDYRAEQSLVYEREYEEWILRLEGRADGIFTEEGTSVIDEIKGVYQQIEKIEEPSYVHLAQAMCYACIFAEQNSRERMGVQMTYANLETEEIRRFYREFSAEELSVWFEELLASYEKWITFRIQWQKKRNASIEGLSFPFAYREGQKRLVSGIYRSLKAKRQLFVQAPTGVGKTMSAIFPAVRVLYEEKADKIFYLTAKTIVRTIAQESFAILRREGFFGKILTITAKEKMCICESRECDPEVCPCARGHYDRINEAVFNFLNREDVFDRENMCAYGDRYQVCPYELSLELSLWVDAIICDYNYVFDPAAQLQQFFGEGNQGEYLFLIDEAHNLVERGREMYSASLCKEEVLAACKKISDRSIRTALKKLNRCLLEYKRECEAYRVLESMGNLPLLVMNVTTAFDKFMELHPEYVWEEELLEFYFSLQSFLFISDLVDEHYVVYTSMEQGSFFFHLYCVNPAANLRQCLDRGRSSLFFSATLFPVEYYRSMLSTREDDYTLYVPSPFPQENRLLLIGRDVSTQYTVRGYETYRKMASYVRLACAQKKGNYMVFFPSYQMLWEVADIYEAEFWQREEQELLCQSQNMTEKDREEFLQQFQKESEKSLVAFCVLGGIFSEGIDLKGASLIGVLIMGTGIPQIGPEKEILKMYYDREKNCGFDYAYRIPGMNKVLQAAGRVIRSMEDEGIILLLDRRFLYRESRSLFPPEWGDAASCTLENAGEIIRIFWDKRTPVH